MKQLEKENEELKRINILLMEENSNLKAEKGTLNEKLHFSTEA